MKVAIVLAFTASDFPLDTKVGVLQVDILHADGTVAASSQAAPYEFAGIEPGEYVLRATQFDDAGVTLGKPFAEAFTVGTVSINLPSGVTINVSPD